MSEHNTRRFLALLVAALAVGVVALGLTLGGASAQLADGNITLDQPDNQQVEVDVSATGAADVTAELTNDGSVVADETISVADGDNDTLTLDTTGLASGEVALNVTADDETVVEVDETRVVTEMTDALEANENDTVAVDVEFDATETTTADVTISDNGTDLNSTTLEFDPIDYEDGSGMLTHEYEVSQDYGNVNATVETAPASGYEGAWVSVDDDSGFLGGGGIIAGAERNQILGFFAVIVGLVLAYNRDMI